MLQYVESIATREQRYPQSEFVRGNEIEHAFKLCEKILDGKLCTFVDIDEMQYRFMLGKETVAAVFVLRRLPEESDLKPRSCFLPREINPLA